MGMQHDYDKILTRLTVILSRLYQAEQLKPSDLAKEFNVSERTIQRDFKDRLMNFPIYYENKHWKMQKDFKIEKNISVEDAITLDILENLSINLGDKFHSKASTILNKLKNRLYSPIFTKLNMEDISNEYESMISFEDAITQKYQIEVKYISRYKEEVIVINPIKIVNFEGLWYLIATDSNNILKSYYIKNITLLNKLDTKFEISKKVESILNNAISVWFTEDEPFEVILEIDNYVAKYFKSKPISNTQKILNEDEQKLTISVMATNDMEIIPIVKSWMPFIKVISPSRIHESVMDEAMKFLRIE
ncbi:transcriptional regulator, YafY family [Aliarcobacter cibarius]|uniref:helix-turn-helix transcriptional regulator n=1 Tax=Aliarcobacter cibarius TaxID=255507 RepID=UPI001243E89C|nr:WYL domain-containing protein [Aliarcobacter cibarius]QEZ88361.1 transcriptional regulator, YafY family [Aliarcobacter cibarius]